jgi:hypothetical protein
MNAKNEGLKQKYVVTRVDRRPIGYTFVLEYEGDPFAIPALKAYAEACKDDYPKLAEDLMKIVEEHG